MITPRLYRRSLAAGAQWRLLVLFWASLLLPAIVASMPVSRFLEDLLDHSTAGLKNVAWVDGATLIELVRQLSFEGKGTAVENGIAAGVVAVLFVAPLVSGATIAAARTGEPLRFPRLLAGGGELYGRMLRTMVVGLIPLGIGACIAAAMSWGLGKANEKEIWETVATRRRLFTVAGSGVVLFVCHLLVDLTRAQFAADPTRTSALLALWASVRVFLRRPLSVLGLGLTGAFVAFVPAAVLMLIRARLTQASIPVIAFAWVLAQGAQLAIGWGRNTRLFGLAELVRADALDGPRLPAFNVEPKVGSPPAPALEATPLPSLPEDPSPDLSTPDRSVT